MLIGIFGGESRWANSGLARADRSRLQSSPRRRTLSTSSSASTLALPSLSGSPSSPSASPSSLCSPTLPNGLSNDASLTCTLRHLPSLLVPRTRAASTTAAGLPRLGPPSPCSLSSLRLRCCRGAQTPSTAPSRTDDLLPPRLMSPRPTRRSSRAILAESATGQKARQPGSAQGWVRRRY